jgi:ABC-type bacteriocin/lantibiotic exporter with double-glycine peptidase domain
VKPSKPPFIPQQRSNTCCLACLRMALADQGLPVPSEDELLTQANMQSEGIDFTELQRLARSLGLRARIEFPKDADAIPGHISQGKTVIAQIDRFPLDGEANRHAVVIVGSSDDSVAFLDPLRATLTPPGERSVARELFDDIHQISLICDLP